jgi:hypothetical protein
MAVTRGRLNDVLHRSSQVSVPLEYLLTDPGFLTGLLAVDL